MFSSGDGSVSKVAETFHTLSPGCVLTLILELLLIFMSKVNEFVLRNGTARAQP